MKKFNQIRSQMIFVVLGILGGAQAGTSVWAAERTKLAASGPARVPLLELYSSEACSSCPPADAWVSKLRNAPGLFKQFVPIVFHVHYWNHLGWVDALSSKQMTDRQVAVSNRWAEPSV